MNERIAVLLKTIEQLRAELDEVVNNSESLTDKEVVMKSRELDKLLTEYYELLMNKTKS